MTEPNLYEEWKRRHARANVPEAFAERVMHSIHVTRVGFVPRALSALALAAGVLLVALLHAGAVSALLLAMGGAAQ